MQFTLYSCSNALPYDVVPNKEVEIQIAEVALVSAYDEGVLLSKPFDVSELMALNGLMSIS